MMCRLLQNKITCVLFSLPPVTAAWIFGIGLLAGVLLVAVTAAGAVG